MIAPQFPELVTSLRDHYLRSVAERERVQEGYLPPGERLERDFAVERGMLPLGMEYFFELYLHPEGRLLFYNTLVEEVWEQRGDQWSLALGLRIGSHRYPDLETMLPPPPEGATGCRACTGTGRVPQESGWRACWECNGLGWLPAGLADLIEWTAAELRKADGDLQQTTVVARRFFAEGSAIFGVSRAALTYLDTALRLAGFDNKKAGELGEIAEPYLDEVRRRDAPVEVSAPRVPSEQLDDPPGKTHVCTLHGQPFTGVVYSTWQNGCVDERTFRSGLSWGPYREYAADGRLTHSGYFVARLRHGVWRSWFRDGRKLSVESVQYGVTVRDKSWDEQGQVSRDYALESEPTSQWYLNELQENRRKFGPLIEAERIPEEYTRLSEADWQ